ncbi:MAG: methyltransferase domain-containing protein [Alphaproteobacteria bacterium]|nr:MAG: methyltransferase domain-containing protein [Alphaproteobacteria bacterium]
MTKSWPGEADIQTDLNFTINDFLGGSVRLIQPREGYRVSMDTVFLAASVPARPGERVLEGGVGSGGASVLLAWRLAGVQVHGIDIQDDMLALARRNVDFNELSSQVTLAKGCVTDLSGPEGQYDHVMVNPPYLEPGTAIRPPAASKGLAHMDSTAALKDWVNFCLHNVKHKGTVTIVYRADRMDEVIARLYRRVGDIRIMPFWPRQGVAAKRVIIQGRKGVRGVASILPGLALHGEEDRYTAEAEAILRRGEALDLKSFACSRQ